MIETWVLVIWGIGLAGALIPTAMVLKEVTLVVRALVDIRRLADRTAVAARGVARHLESAPNLPALIGSTDGLIQASQRLKGAGQALDVALHSTPGASAMERLVGRIVRWFAAARSR